MPRIIEALAKAPLSEDPVHFSKLDINDGFWRMVHVVGEKWSFAFVFPNHLEAPKTLVIPSALLMGWALSPCFFHVASETACDVAESYAHEHVGTLPEHPIEGITISEILALQNASMWGTNECNKFLTLLEGEKIGSFWRYFATILYTWHKQVTQHNCYICQEHCYMETTAFFHCQRCQGTMVRIRYLRRSWMQVKAIEK